MVTAAHMQARFPEAFGSTATSVLDAAIAEAQRQESQTFWGSLYNDAVLYKAAHLAQVGRVAAGSGLASASAGAVSVSYKSGTDAASTGFLALYEALLRRAGAPSVTVSKLVGVL